MYNRIHKKQNPLKIIQYFFFHRYNILFKYRRKYLEYGKHVLVEFPIAFSSQVASELYQLASKKGNTWI